MRIEELKKAKDQQPFLPFLIRMADGREIPVRHPDAVAWDSPRVAICAVPGGWEVVEVGLITSLALQHPADLTDGAEGRGVEPHDTEQ